MALELQFALAILATHFVFDFILQSDWMAKGKSKSLPPLLSHVGVYLIGLLLIAAFLPVDHWAEWAVLNAVLHFGVDFLTSRASSHMWNKGRTHDFFVVIGFDQLIHAACLIGTFGLMTTL